MLEMIFYSIWFFLPAGFANMAPVLVKKLPILNIPISKKYLGLHKTYRGFLFGVLFALLITWLQNRDLIIGLLMGFGALFGDSAKSFFKRRAGVKAGKDWIPFDQIDWILGAFLFVAFYEKISLPLFLVTLVIFFVFHVFFNVVRAFLKL
jgi:CDP-2,3-bis-(O-geranylgeranyl)-sn-glycerol synthase